MLKTVRRTEAPYNIGFSFSASIANCVKRLVSREPFKAALVLALILNIDFFPCLWGNKTLLESAQVVQSITPGGAWAGKRVPALRYAKTLDPAAAAWMSEALIPVVGQDLRHGTFPLWNPYQAFGAPLAADMQSQAFYPLADLLSLHVSPTTYNWFILTRLFIAGICTFLYLRLFLSFPSALAGGIASLLAGYYLLYVTIAGLDVEVLVPAGILAVEFLLRKRNLQSVIAFAIIFYCAVTGGMPESTLLTFTFVYAYALYRVLTDVSLRRIWVQVSSYLTGATIAGLGLSAVLLIPFLEFMRHSFNAHEPSKYGGAVPGLLWDPWGVSVLTYIFPLLFGPPFAQTFAYNWSGIRNYTGIIVFFLSLIALLCAARSRKVDGDRHVRSLTWFFAGFALLVVAKRYGVQPLNWVLAHLPLFRMVLFFKYDEPLLSCCLAVLCAIGLEWLIKGRASAVIQVSSLLAAFSLIPIAILVSRQPLTKELFTDHLPPAFPVLAIGIPACLMFLVAVVIFAFGRKVLENPNATRAGTCLAVCMIGLLTLELSTNFIAEIYYTLNALPDKAENAYAGAPYIDWLKNHRNGKYRIFARDGILFPNWASVFQLPDIRDLDALLYKKYLPFVRALLGRPDQPIAQDLEDRFIGSGPYDYAFDTPVERRLLELTSTKYIITARPYSPPVPFRLVYDHELKIYAYDDVLPRAAIYYRASIARNEQEILKRLIDPDFDVFRTVLLDATKLKPAEVRAVEGMNRGDFRSANAGTVLSYNPGSVKIRANLEQSGVLVLNDTDYPGWAVSVDGRSSRWFTANYIFRGVLLGPGEHDIRFVYRPRTFYSGLIIAALTVLILVIYGVIRRRQSKASIAILQPGT